MKKSSKLVLIGKILMWVFIALIAILIAVYYYLGSIVKGAIQQFVPPITGTNVQVEDIDLSLLSGKIEIKGLEVANPAGYQKENIFELGKISIQFQPKTVLSDKIIIDSIVIANTKVDAELKNLTSLESNIGTIQKNVDNYLGSSSKKDAPAKKVEKTTETLAKKSGKSVGIKNLKITGTEISLGVQGQTMTMPMPDIEQKNIGMGQKSMSASDMIAKVLDLISVESLQSISQNASEMAKKGLKNLTDSLKDGGDSLGKTAKETLGSFKNMFK